MTFRNIIAGFFAVFASFFLTLWLTEPPQQRVPPADVISMLTKPETSIRNFEDLSSFLQRVGFVQSQTARGAIDTLTREGAVVRVSGWAVEAPAKENARGAPILVMFFSDNKNVGYIRTSGERPDVTQALKLADAYTANTKLEGRIQCRPGSGLDISLVGLGGTYGFLGTKSCP